MRSKKIILSAKVSAKIMLFIGILLSGCTNNKVPSSKDLFVQAKKKYKEHKYKEAAKLSGRIEENYMHEPISQDAMLLQAKSYLELGKSRNSQADLLEAIKVCDFIILTNPEYAMKHDVYMIKIRAYYNSISWDLDLCSNIVIDTMKTISEYEQILKENKAENDIHNIGHNIGHDNVIHRNELQMIKNRCSAYLTQKELRSLTSFIPTLPVVALGFCQSIREEKDYYKSCPESFYREMQIYDKIRRNVVDLFALLEELYGSCKRTNKDDLGWLEKGITIVEQEMNRRPKRVTQEQKDRIKYFKRLIYINENKAQKQKQK